MLIFFPRYGMENIVGKEENAGYQFGQTDS